MHARVAQHARGLRVRHVEGRGRHAGGEQVTEGLDRALALAPDAFGLHFHRGVVLGTLDRYEQSAASFDRALTLEPTSAESLNNRGVALEYLQRTTEALESFAKAVALRPNYIDAYTNSGNTLPR